MDQRYHRAGLEFVIELQMKMSHLRLSEVLQIMKHLQILSRLVCFINILYSVIKHTFFQ